MRGWCGENRELGKVNVHLHNMVTREKKVSFDAQRLGPRQSVFWTDLFSLTFCHTETEVADQIFFLVYSYFIDTGCTCQSSDRITPSFCTCERVYF